MAVSISGDTGISKVQDGAVTSDALATGAVTSAKLGSSAVTADAVASNAITETKISDTAVTSAKLGNTIDFDGKKLIVPTGTTAERPVSPTVGELRFNTDNNVLEQYSGTAWRNAYDPLPEITSVSPTDFNGESGTTITVNGNYFTSDTVVSVKPLGGSYTNATTTFVNSNQVTFTTPSDYTVAQSPLDIKITQNSGTDEYTSALTTGQSPSWVTASGALTAGDALSAYSQSVSATDSDGTVTYAITSGSLPTGLSLNGSTGEISGTVGSIANDTTYNFGITATDNAGNSAGERSFSIAISGTNYDVQVLMVAGGGAGGTSLHGGGGGAGGTTITSTTFVKGSSAKTVTIGAGASNGTSNPAPNGSNTSFTGLTTVLGGGGGCTRQATGATGGCGGGAGYEGAGGTGTSGQGFNGGLGVRSPDYRGGGGGGSAQAGWGGGSTGLGAGGQGKEFPTGSGTRYGGGGGGSCYGTSNVPVGGAGGGGNGARGDGSIIAQNGTANTGGGGGGRERNSNSGGAGGSGIVIVRYAGSQKGTGGTVATSGGYTTHTFTSSGTYNP